MLRELKREHHVIYLTLDDGGASSDAAARAAEYSHELIQIPFHATPKFSPRFYRELVSNLASPLPYFIAKYRSAEMESGIRRQLDSGRCDLVVCDFLNPSINLPAGIEIPTLLFQHNVEAMIWRRHFEVASNPLKKAFLRLQWRRAFRYEANACARFDKVVAVSPEDARVIETQYGIENVGDVPTGVDTDFFRPAGTVARKPHNLVFTGSMDWLPNEDAIRWFVEEIYPLLKKRVPDVSLTVVGRNPFPSLHELAGRDPSVEVTGRVPDVRPYMEAAEVYVIPLRIGGGTRLKVFEAMAMERPIVSTTVGAEGLPVRDGENLLLADDPAAFTEAVVRLFSDSELASKVAANAAGMVRRDFGWPGVATQFMKSCAEAVAQRAKRSSADLAPPAALRA
jgi:glycosyltransferase involved in cell wall biosynthesis